MKKLLLLVLGFSLALLTFAEENILQVFPCTIEAGITENDYDEGHVMYIDIVNSLTNITGIQFDLYLPEGLSVETKCTELDSERFDGITSKKYGFTPYATYELTDKGSGHYLFTLYHNDLQSVMGTSGHAIILYYTTTATIAAGVYPINIKNIEFKPVEGEKIKIANSTSYVTVGSPSNATLSVKGVLPSFVTSSLPAGMTVDLTEATAVYGSGSNDVTAKYNRTVGDKAWNTICLPFAAKSDANIQFYSVSSIGSDALEVAGVSTLEAGTPALAKVTGSAINISATSALSTTLKNGGNLIGTFEPINVTDADAYYIKDNKFYQCNTEEKEGKIGFNVAAFKAYIKGSSGAKAILDITESDATAINAICGEGEVSVDAIYGVNGARQNDLKKGINIVTLSNGSTKKIIVK